MFNIMFIWILDLGPKYVWIVDKHLYSYWCRDHLCQALKSLSSVAQNLFLIPIFYRELRVNRLIHYGIYRVFQKIIVAGALISSGKNSLKPY